MRIACLVSSFLLALLTACGDDAKPAADADTSADSAADSTGDTAADSADSASDSADTAEDSAPDTTADTAADTAPDTAADTTPDVPDASCEYFEEIELLKCGEAHVQILHWKDFGPSACEDYYTRGDDRYETLDALATAEGCEAGCVYVASQAVDFIRCDQQGRSGFETFTAGGEGCLEALYRTEDGIFPDLCLWATYACYCTPPE